MRSGDWVASLESELNWASLSSFVALVVFFSDNLCSIE